MSLGRACRRIVVGSIRTDPQREDVIVSLKAIQSGPHMRNGNHHVLNHVLFFIQLVNSRRRGLADATMDSWALEDVEDDDPAADKSLSAASASTHCWHFQ